MAQVHWSWYFVQLTELFCGKAETSPLRRAVSVILGQWRIPWNSAWNFKQRGRESIQHYSWHGGSATRQEKKAGSSPSSAWLRSFVIALISAGPVLKNIFTCTRIVIWKDAEKKEIRIAFKLKKISESELFYAGFILQEWIVWSSQYRCINMLTANQCENQRSLNLKAIAKHIYKGHTAEFYTEVRTASTKAILVIERREQFCFHKESSALGSF